MSTPQERSLAIRAEGDIVLARRTAREAANEMGFGVTDTTRIVTAASELARNIVKYAGEGMMAVRTVADGGDVALEIEFVDRGPGIVDIPQALSEGFSSSGGLGMGLPGAKKLMDDMDIQSTAGEGTRVVIRKWRRG